MHILIGIAQSLLRKQGFSTEERGSQLTQDVVAWLAIHSQEVIRIHLPDKASPEPIVVGVPHLDINRVLVIIGDPVSALVHVGGKVAAVPVPVLLVMDGPLVLAHLEKKKNKKEKKRKKIYCRWLVWSTGPCLNYYYYLLLLLLIILIILLLLLLLLP